MTSLMNVLFKFLSGCHLNCTYNAIDKEKEAKERKELRLDVSSVDYMYV